MIHVFKFGGASVKDAAGIKNLTQIVSLNQDKPLLIVISAMGKTTNSLEKLAQAYFNKSADTEEIFAEIKNYHYQIVAELFGPSSQSVSDEVANTFVEIDWILEEEPHDDFDFIYDQIVSIGELVSTRIVHAYLLNAGMKCQWIDARSYIHTDNNYREAKVDWEKTKSLIQKQLPDMLQQKLLVTQGFIGGTSENFTTTLGREGSDYTAAIFAHSLNAEAVTIWKDVPGVLNADPKYFKDTLKYDELSYSEALEMTYYGATVIHPKTIKPLQNVGIPLFVKPFLQPDQVGTLIHENAKSPADIPAIIIKNEQVLISISTKDLSFIDEDHLSKIFKIFADNNIKVNMMQSSAISFSICFDWNVAHFDQLIGQLKLTYQVKYNTGLKLLTIRHFKKDGIEKFISGSTILLEQLSRNTAQLVLRSA